MGENIAILGGGAFGTSMASLLVDNGCSVSLWCYEKEVCDSIKINQENKTYLPGIKLSAEIKTTNDIQEVVERSKWIFLAMPVEFLRNVLEQIKPFVKKEQILVCLSKGIEQDSLLFPVGIVEDILGFDFSKALISGPNFAKEIVQKCETATVVGAQEESVAQELIKLLSNSYFKPQFCDDLIGVQVGGAVKNVYALAAGMVSTSCNSSALLITQGLLEMAKLSEFLGGKKETVYGLSGLGDLILSTTGLLSKNLRAGKLLQEGKSLDDLKKEFKVLPEGINTLKSVYQLIQKHKLDLPICKATYETVFEGKAFKVF